MLLVIIRYHIHLDTLLLAIWPHRLDYLSFGGDGINGAHEDVSDDVDRHEAV